MQQTFRSTDILARMGGDEFMILMLDISEEQAHTALGRLNLPKSH